MPRPTLLLAELRSTLRVCSLVPGSAANDESVLQGVSPRYKSSFGTQCIARPFPVRSSLAVPFRIETTCLQRRNITDEHAMLQLQLEEYADHGNQCSPLVYAASFTASSRSAALPLAEVGSIALSMLKHVSVASAFALAARPARLAGRLLAVPCLRPLSVSPALPLRSPVLRTLR